MNLNSPGDTGTGSDSDTGRAKLRHCVHQLRRCHRTANTREGSFAADIAQGWDVRGNPHGGYLLALVTRAPSGRAELHGWMRHCDRDPDPLTLLMFSDGMAPALFEAVGRGAPWGCAGRTWES